MSTLGYKHTPEARARMSAAHRGSKHTPEAKAKISAAHKGKTLSPEHKAKIGAASRTRKHTPETREKIAASQRGCKHSDDRRAKNAAVHMGHAVSDETRAKIAAAKWKGDDVGYRSSHRRHDKVLPKACALTDETCEGELQSAFDHGTPPEFVKIDPRTGCRYSTRVEDYLRLCKSHHVRYDRRAS